MNRSRGQGGGGERTSCGGGGVRNVGYKSPVLYPVRCIRQTGQICVLVAPAEKRLQVTRTHGNWLCQRRLGACQGPSGRVVTYRYRPGVLDYQKPPAFSTSKAQLRGSHVNSCAAVWWPKCSKTAHVPGSCPGSVLSSLPGQRSLFDSVRPVDGQTRSPRASGTPFPSSQKDIRPAHGRGAPAGAARPGL